MGRTTFYVTTDLFEQAVSRTAKLVLTYLSRVANRAGVCFPSVATIAKNCACCENTARKAINELCEAGIVKKDAYFRETVNGKTRQHANRYTLMLPASPSVSSTAKTEPTPPQPLNPPPAKNEGEIHNNSKLTMAQNTPSVRNDLQDGTELWQILDKLYLHLYYDKLFAKSIEHAIRTMFYADHIVVRGRTIPQGAVRNVLHMLTIDHIDFINRQLRNFQDPVINSESYLISCIYNAPMDCMIIRLQDSP